MVDACGLKPHPFGFGFKSLDRYLFNILFSWVLVFIIIELFHSTNLSYQISILFTTCILLIAFIFYCDFDLFACFILSIYSSVFFLISLFFIYFNKYWSLTWNSNTYTYFSYLVIIVVMLFSINFYNTDGFTFFFSKVMVFKHIWIFRLYCYDLYSLYFNIYDNFIFLLHLFFYKLFIFFSLMLNVYFFFGIVLSITFLLAIRVWSNPGYLMKFILLKKASKWLFFPKHIKLLLINKFKRQVRRQNSSIIKFNNKGRFEFIWYRNYRKLQLQIGQGSIDYKRFTYIAVPDEGMPLSEIT